MTKFLIYSRHIFCRRNSTRLIQEISSPLAPSALICESYKPLLIMPAIEQIHLTASKYSSSWEAFPIRLSGKKLPKKEMTKGVRKKNCHHNPKNNNWWMKKIQKNNLLSMNNSRILTLKNNKTLIKILIKKDRIRSMLLRNKSLNLEIPINKSYAIAKKRNVLNSTATALELIKLVSDVIVSVVTICRSTLIKEIMQSWS